MDLKETIEKYGLTVKYFKAETHTYFYLSPKETAEDYLKEHGKTYSKLEFTGKYSKDKVPSLFYKATFRNPRPAYWGVKTDNWPGWREKYDFFAPTLEEALEKAIEYKENKNK